MTKLIKLDCGTTIGHHIKDTANKVSTYEWLHVLDINDTTLEGTIGTAFCEDGDSYNDIIGVELLIAPGSLPAIIKFLQGVQKEGEKKE